MACLKKRLRKLCCCCGKVMDKSPDPANAEHFESPSLGAGILTYTSPIQATENTPGIGSNFLSLFKKLKKTTAQHFIFSDSAKLSHTALLRKRTIVFNDTDASDKNDFAEQDGLCFQRDLRSEDQWDSEGNCDITIETTPGEGVDIKWEKEFATKSH